MLREAYEFRSVSAAAAVRRSLARLFDAPPASRIVLVPGINLALKLLLSQLKIGRIALTPDEYYEAKNFSAQRAEVLPLRRILAAKPPRFDAILASVGSWRGRIVANREFFWRVRASNPRRRPLLIADYSHAGAGGFPSVRKLGADIVCGDAEKWIRSPDTPSRIGFIWFRDQAIFEKAIPQFAPFYLATGFKPANLAARWLAPEALRELGGWFARRDLLRARLLQRFRADIQLAHEVAASLNLAPPETAMFWSAKEPRPRRYWERRGVVVQAFPRQRGVRIMCRSDLGHIARA